VGRRSLASTAGGALVAVALLAVGIVPWHSAEHPDRTPPARDVGRTPVHEIRQFDEGVATSHYSASGARLTGNAEIAGAPLLVVLGDSHVEAMQVRDSVTMGAVVERSARASHVPVNVVQYGWGGAGWATYAAVAPLIETRLQPDAVVLMLSDNDWKPEGEDVSWLQAPPGARGTSGARAAAKELLLRVPLAAMSYRRIREIRSAAKETHAFDAAAPGPKGVEVADTVLDPVSRDSVRSMILKLKATYGSRLGIVYMASVGVSTGAVADPYETDLTTFCREHGIRCASTRPAMVLERARGRASRGFPTGLPGIGHLNEHGHRITAGAIWQVMQPVLASSREG
jgi:hypothetical protein